MKQPCLTGCLVARKDSNALVGSVSAGASPPCGHDEQEPDRFVELPDGMRLCYRAYGGASGTPLLLIAGLGLQLISWPEAFVQALVTAGYWVIAPDNRDVGKSFRVGTRPPGKLRQILRWPPPDSYSLDDMADDMTRLLQSLEIPAAHVIGMSMGGMIGQTLASRHAERVLTLTSIFSTTGAVDVGQPALSALLRQDRSESRTSSEATNRYVNIMRYVGDPQAPGIESEWSAYALRAWERNGNRANASGSGRQIGAILKSGDRTAQLRRIKAPTLVIHGDRDLLVHPSGGAATAAAIPGARLVTVPGLRHQIDSMRSPELAGLIVRHIKESTKALGLTVNERT